MALFITGHDRSGTTLLQKLCNDHPEMMVTNEFNIFLPLGLSYLNYSKQILESLLRVKNKFPYNQAYQFLGKKRFSNFPFTITFLMYLLQSHHAQITVEDVEDALRKIAPQAKVVGDKRTYYNEYLPTITRNEGLVGIIIYRDARDVAASFLQKARTTWKNQAWAQKYNTAASVAQRWVTYMEMMEQFSGNHYTIRYENLVQEPNKELLALGSWLGVSAAGFQLSKIQSSSIGNFQQGLKSGELGQVLDIAGSTMARFGYL